MTNYYTYIAKGIVEANNVRINGLDIGLTHVRDGAVYIGEMTATAKVVNSSTLPIVAKLAATLRKATAYLIGYNMVSNNLSSDINKGYMSIDMDMDKINSDLSVYK